MTTHGAANDHLSVRATLLLLHEGHLAVGPPRQLHELQPGEAILVPPHRYTARRMLGRAARWQEIDLDLDLPACALSRVPWGAAFRCLQDVLAGGPGRLALPGPLPLARQTSRVTRACRLLDAESRRGIDLMELSGRLRTPPHTLVRSFRRELGTTPQQYLIHRRLALARRYLREGMSPSDAALCAGFYDQSHLGRHLKRKLGLTPASYGDAKAAVSVG